MTMSKAAENVFWSPEDEIQLFFALDGLKPVGINKYFFMVLIAERLSKALSREVSTEAIWTHLNTMYNLDALDEMEKLPFPNETREFELPEAEFKGLISKKTADTVGETANTNNNSGYITTDLTNSSAASQNANTKVTSKSGNQVATGTILTLSSQTSNSSTTSSSSSTSTHAAGATAVSSNNGVNPKAPIIPQTNAASQIKEREDRDRKSSSKPPTVEARRPLPPKRTRGSMSLESNSPSTTPPPMTTNNKRRRI